MSLHARTVSYRAGARVLLREVGLRAEPGRVHAVLGPNGAGKSTLLRLLAGELKPQSGGVECAGRPLRQWSARELARLRAVLPQRDQLSFGFTAEEVVRLGRLPCPSPGAERELEIVLAAMDLTGVEHLRARRYTTLSGGERTRVQLARVLVQIWEPVELGARALLLDEPTASLDLAHQHRCLRVARDFAARGVAVVVVLHDPNLVMGYADEVTLLHHGEVLAQGTPRDVLSAARLAKVYDVPVEMIEAGGRAWVRVASERIQG